MAIREIRKWDDPVLHKISREVTVFDKRLHDLLDDMYETMQEANGVGIAAVQVGILRRAVVIDIGEGPIELVNPEVVSKSEECISKSEGCLSFPGQYGMVERPAKVTVKAQDRNGKPFEITGEGVFARAMCHETDHTNGIVFVDLATEMLEND